MIYQFTMVQSQPQQGAFLLSAQARNNTNRNKNSMAAAQITTGSTRILLQRGKTPPEGGAKSLQDTDPETVAQLHANFRDIQKGDRPGRGHRHQSGSDADILHPKKEAATKKCTGGGRGHFSGNLRFLQTTPGGAAAKDPQKHRAKKRTEKRAGTPRQGCPLKKPKHFRRSATAFAVYHDAGADARAMEDCKTWTETQQERKSAAG